MTMPEPTETVVALPSDIRTAEPVAVEPAPTLPPELRASLDAVAPPQALEPASPDRPTYLDEYPVEPVPAKPSTAGAVARVDLGGDQWADIRDPDQIRSGHRKAVTRRMSLNASMGSQVVEVMEEVLAFAIVGWSLDLPLPSVDRASLDELRPEQEDALQSDPTIVEIAQRLSSNLQMLNPARVSLDPNSPTGPSSV